MESIMKTTLKRLISLLLAVAMTLALTACAQNAPAPSDPTDAPTPAPAATPEPTPEATPEPSDDDVDGELILDYEEPLQYATQFTLTHYKGGYAILTIPHSGDTNWLLVPEGKSVPEELPENTVVLQQPLNKIASGVTAMVSVIDAIGGLDNVVATTTKQESWNLPNVAAAMEAGKLKYFGSYSEPDFELLMSEGIQLEVDSTMILNKPEVMDKYKEVGIPCMVDCSSYEEHPLGRVEWVKLYGAILNMEEEAEAFFNEEAAKIETLSALEKTGKTAVMYYVSSDTYYLRNAGDYTVAMLNLAGGETIAPDVGPDKSGSTKMTFEEFYATCKDADYIFYVVLTCPFETREEMIAENALYADFKAVQEDRVFTTRPGFSQSAAMLADVVVEINSVLNDPTIEETENLIKIK